MKFVVSTEDTLGRTTIIGQYYEPSQAEDIFNELNISDNMGIEYVRVSLYSERVETVKTYIQEAFKVVGDS